MLAALSYKPRDVSEFLPSIEASLNDSTNAYRIDIASASIDWRNIRQLGRITLSQVTVSLTDGKVFAVVPHIQVSLSLLPMLVGKAHINWLIIPDAVIVLTRDEHNQMRIGFDSKDANIPIAALLEQDASRTLDSRDKHDMPAQFSLPFTHALLENARVFIRDTSGKLLLKTFDSDLSFSNTSTGIHGAVRLNFLYKGERGAANMLLDYVAASSRVTVHSQLSHIPSGIVCAFSPQCGVMKGVKGIISGKISTIIASGKVDTVSAAIIMDNARFDKPEWFDTPKVFSRMALVGQASQHLRNIRLTTFDLQSAQTRILASGTLLRTDRGTGMDMQAAVIDMNAQDLPDYWPKNLLPDTKQWIKQNITKGMISKATVHVKMTPQEASLAVLPDHALEAQIAVKDAYVRFIPGLEPIDSLSGVIAFTGQTMKINLKDGTIFSETRIPSASIIVEDLNHPNLPMQAHISLEGSAKDAARLLTHKAFIFDDTLKLDKDTIRGRITSDISLQFDAYSDASLSLDDSATHTAETEMDLSKVRYDIGLQFYDLAQSKFMGLLDIEHATGALRANDEGMNLKGQASVFGAGIAVELKQIIGQDVHLLASGNLNRSALIALGMPDRPEIGEGEAGFSINALVQKNDAWIENAQFDFNKLHVKIPDISWDKSIGVPGVLDVTRTEGRSYRWIFAGDNLRANGGFSLSEDGKEITEFSVKKLTHPNNQFTLQYQKNRQGLKINLQGNALDNSMAFQASDNSLLADFPAVDLRLDLKKLTLVQAHPFKHVKGQLLCDFSRCTRADFTAELAQARISSFIAQVQGKRTLSIRSTDAGEMLRALDITDRVFGGSFALLGHYDDSTQPAKFLGNLVIDKFTVRQSEVLGRIFSVASLSGLANALTGSGISFDVLRADIMHQAGLVSVDNGRAHGNAVGYTTSGTVDTRDATLRLKGVLVPAYALNSMVNNIPVIGMIAGGKGEGIISFNYAINGSYSAPEVTVNPLSGLTPGFLRNIFGVLDEKSAKATENKPLIKENTKKKIQENQQK